MKTLLNISTKRNLYLLPLFIVLLAFAMPACNTTDSGSKEEERFEDGILVEVRELLGDSLITAIETELEVPIHRGENPPDIAAMFSQNNKNASSKDEAGLTFVMKPYTLLASNVPEDIALPGNIFLDMYVRFSDQDTENFIIDLDLTHPGRSAHLGPGSFIVGDSNRFTVFAPTESKRNEGTIRSMHIISGVINEKSITSLLHVILLIDDGGVGGLIPEGSGRSFIDEDGTAEITQWPGSGSLNLQAPDGLENLKVDDSILR